MCEDEEERRSEEAFRGERVVVRSFKRRVEKNVMEGHTRKKGGGPSKIFDPITLPLLDPLWRGLGCSERLDLGLSGTSKSRLSCVYSRRTPFRLSWAIAAHWIYDGSCNHSGQTGHNKPNVKLRRGSFRGVLNFFFPFLAGLRLYVRAAPPFFFFFMPTKDCCQRQRNEG